MKKQAKKHFLPGLPGLVALALSLAGPAKAATSYYFDQNGTTTGFGMTSGGVYTWDNPAVGTQYWNTASNGNNGTLSAWSGTDNVAVFATSGAGNGYTVNLQSNVALSGIVLNSALSSGQTVLFQAASAKTITFASGGSISNVAGGGRNLYFGDNINITGDFTLSGNGNVSIQGAGNLYSGTITLHSTASQANNNALQVNTNHRYASTTKVVLDVGIVRLASDASVTFAELKGSGGQINGNSGSKMILDQSSNTTWSGALGSNSASSSTTAALAFEKKGAGAFALTGATDHGIRGEITVSGGALYIAGNLLYVNAVAATNVVTVKANATFGGTTTSNKQVTLELSLIHI